MFNDIKITINGTELDLAEVIEDNEGEPLDAVDILEAVKYELENVAGDMMDHIRIIDTSKIPGGF